jgi:hypothetical protein
MKISKHFDFEELVPPSIWKTYGIASRQFLRPELITSLDLLRDILGRPVTVNNWHAGGAYKESGYRLPDTRTGARYSQHKFGAAADVKVPGMTPREVLAVILNNQQRFIEAGLTTYENPDFTPTWLHVDCRWRSPMDGLVMVNP